LWAVHTVFSFFLVTVRVPAVGFTLPTIFWAGVAVLVLVGLANVVATMLSTVVRAVNAVFLRLTFIVPAIFWLFTVYRATLKVFSVLLLTFIVSATGTAVFRTVQTIFSRF
jgi:hypothetical protein